MSQQDQSDFQISYNYRNDGQKIDENIEFEIDEVQMRNAFNLCKRIWSISGIPDLCLHETPGDVLGI